MGNAGFISSTISRVHGVEKFRGSGFGLHSFGTLGLKGLGLKGLGLKGLGFNA